MYAIRSYYVHQRVREGYLTLADGNPRFALVDANGTQEQVAARIRELVGRCFGARKQ